MFNISSMESDTWELTDSQRVLTCWATVTAAFDFLFAVLTVEVVVTGRTCIHCMARDFYELQIWQGAEFGSSGFFEEDVRAFTRVISWRGVDGSGGRAGFGLAWRRLPALLPVGSGSGSLGGFLPVVVESDQLPLMRQQRCFVPSEKCPACNSAAAANSPSFCQAGSLFGCERNSFRTAWGLWWSVSVGKHNVLISYGDELLLERRVLK